jgi:SAM-dependent methyltransferase
MGKIDWQADSRSFDAVAERYAAYRPAYPTALIEALLAQAGLRPPARLLEVGGGTGKATRLFAERGFAIHCLEPGPNLAAYAAQDLRDYPRVTFETVTLEQWATCPATYDLVFSAQAFHWVSKAVGYPKAAQALKPGGHLALFWNMYPDPQGPLFAALDAVYQARAPEIAKRPPPYDELIAQRAHDIQVSGCFGPVTISRFPWSATYNAQQYIGLLGTYSDHLRLPEAQRQNLYEGIAAVIDAHGGVIEKPYVAVLYVAPAGRS